jgi:hypothetical protein
MTTDLDEKWERAAAICDAIADVERGGTLHPLASTLAVAERFPYTTDGSWEAATAIAKESIRSLKAIGLRPTAAEAWSMAAKALRAGFRPGDTIVPVKIGGEA